MLMRESRTQGRHAFLSYVREHLDKVDRLQQGFKTAGIAVWRDTRDLWPGEDWQMKIRQAITDNAIAFIACFSHNSLAREETYQNEELTLAIQQLRLRKPGTPWLPEAAHPVRWRAPRAGLTHRPGAALSACVSADGDYHWLMVT